MFLNGKFFYRYLNNPDQRSLFKEIRTREKFIVCLEKPYERFFTSFNNFIDFVAFGQEMPGCYHEVYPEDVNVKMFFDVDISDNLLIFDENRFLGELIDVVKQVFLEEYKSIIKETKDIVILNSSGDTKVSYHIIINNYVHKDITECKHMAELIRKELSDQSIEFIDWAVYAKNRMLRTLGSSKEGRKLIFLDKWMYHDREITFEYPDTLEAKEMMQFEASLLTVSSHCLFLGPKVFKDPKIRENTLDELPKEITLEIIDTLISGYTGGKFKLGKIMTPVICLLRVRASECPICERWHDSENAFLYVSESSEMYNIWYHCRRLSGKSIKVKSILKVFIKEEIPKGDPSDDHQDDPEEPKRNFEEEKILKRKVINDLLSKKDTRENQITIGQLQERASFIEEIRKKNDSLWTSND